MFLLNPRFQPATPTKRSSEIVDKTVAFFEAKGKANLRQDDLERTWYGTSSTA